MKKKNKNEELQSRREFFKKAAKGALPIIGAIALAGMPSLVKAAEKTPQGCLGCKADCFGYCSGGCYTSCAGGCKGNCYNSCFSGCRNTCDGSCSGGCARSAYA